MKIALFHIMGSNFTGAAKTIFRLLCRVDLSKVQPILVGQTENELTERTRSLGIPVSIVKYPAALDVYGKRLLRIRPRDFVAVLWGFCTYNATLMGFLKETRPEVVWADNIRTFVFVYPASKLSGCKIIWNIWSEPEGKVAWCLHRAGLLLADLITLEYTTQSQKLFGRWGQVPFLRRKITTVYTGVTDFTVRSGSNIRDELRLSSKDLVVIMASNISAAKGQLDLLMAMETLVDKFPDMHLLVAGTPSTTDPDTKVYDSKLKRYTAEKGLTNNVHFLGWRSDIPDLLSASDIYVSTSYTESFPDAVREAMLFGIPVIATNVGGTSELVSESKSGFLFEPGDLKSLVLHLTSLVENPQLRTTMGIEGKRIIGVKFSTAVFALEFEEMVRSL